jgi:hypothetical protein
MNTNGHEAELNELARNAQKLAFIRVDSRPFVVESPLR